MPKLIFRLFFSFVLFVSVFVLIQQYLKPDSFGKFGHYRANSIDDNKARTSYYKGEENCITCHEDISELKSNDLHSGVSCESCHSPKINASIECEVMPPKVDGNLKFCGQCHEMNLGRIKKGAPQLKFSEHKVGQNCIECHNPHAPWELKE